MKTTPLQQQIIEISVNDKNIWVLYDNECFSNHEKETILKRAVEILIPHVKQSINCPLLDKVIPALNSKQPLLNLYTEMYAFNSNIKDKTITFIIELMMCWGLDNDHVLKSLLQVLKQITRKL